MSTTESSEKCFGPGWCRYACDAPVFGDICWIVRVLSGLAYCCGCGSLSFFWKDSRIVGGRERRCRIASGSRCATGQRSGRDRQISVGDEMSGVTNKEHEGIIRNVMDDRQKLALLLLCAGARIAKLAPRLRRVKMLCIRTLFGWL
jgi:hypothetical protein